MKGLFISSSVTESGGWKDQTLDLSVFDRAYQKVAISDVVMMKADGNYTLFFFSSGKKIMVTKTLKEYETLLDEHSFVRIHKSYLINMHHLKEYNGTHEEMVVLKNDIRVGIARRRRKDFEVKAAPFLLRKLQ